ncbi:hypothetical protein Ahia01_001061700 [Argonauta hians]
MECSSPNFMHNQLQSPNWTCLLNVIGAESMLILFEEYAMYKIIESTSCVQMTDVTFGCYNDRMSDVAEHLFKRIFERTYVGVSPEVPVDLYCDANHPCTNPTSRRPVAVTVQTKKVPSDTARNSTMMLPPSKCPKCKLKKLFKGKVKPLLEKMVQNHR